MSEWGSVFLKYIYEENSSVEKSIVPKKIPKAPFKLLANNVLYFNENLM